MFRLNLFGRQSLLILFAGSITGAWLPSGTWAADPTPTASVARETPPTERMVFNGKNLDGWKLRREQGSHWVVGKAVLNASDPRKIEVEDSAGHLVNAEARGVDIMTEDEFGDCRVKVDVMVPRGSNSGIYLQGNYEIQVLDSFGKEKVGPGDIGGVYGATAPRVNAARAPGEWQTFVIDFQAPRFENGKKVANAVFKKIVLNGKVIQENVELAGPTGGNLGRGDVPQGPLMFQGDHGPVAFRNIQITVPSQP